MWTLRKKVAFCTLGCKLNFAETSSIARSLPEEQFERVPASAKADIYVINTCSVTDTADKKCRQAIKKYVNKSPGAFIVVAGCYSQLNPGEISSIPGVDLVLGTNEKFDLADYLLQTDKRSITEIYSNEVKENYNFYPSYSMGDRTRSFLKVQDGCDYRCSYCTVPLARGKSRNQEIKALVEEAENISRKGVKEIVLTGVNIGDYGKSTGESLASLLRELVKVDGIERFRISSIEPDLLTDELIELTADSEKILPHFHIPLQSGSDKVLGSMKRRYGRDLFKSRITMIREMMPFAGIGADVIAGFPGESDSDFDDSYKFIAELPLSYLHVFNFSERPGTAACKMAGKIPFPVREKRSRKLISLSQEKHLHFCELNIGRFSSVLFEHTRTDGMITGFTENYLKAEYPWKSGLAGRIKRVRLIRISETGRIFTELTD